MHRFSNYALVFLVLMPISCDDQGSESESSSGEFEGGGLCGTAYEVLDAEDVRRGISGAQIITEFQGMWTHDLEWVGTVSDGVIEFEEKGSSTTVAMSIDYAEGQIRFYDAARVDAKGCAAHFGVEVMFEITTEDGVLTVARPAELIRTAASHEEIADYGAYRAGVRLELAPAEDMSGLDVTMLSPEPAGPLRPLLDTGFRHDGSWDGSVTASLNVSSGAGLATGQTIVFGQW